MGFLRAFAVGWALRIGLIGLALVGAQESYAACIPCVWPYQIVSVLPVGVHYGNGYCCSVDEVCPTKMGQSVSIPTVHPNGVNYVRCDDCHLGTELVPGVGCVPVCVYPTPQRNPVSGLCEASSCQLDPAGGGPWTHLDLDTCTYQYNECSREMGTRRDGNPGGYPLGSPMCVGGCLFHSAQTMTGDMTDMGIVPGGMITIWRPAGTPCVAGEPADPVAEPPVAPGPETAEAPLPPLTDCIWDDNGNKFCTDGVSLENCGYFNDEFVCVAQTDRCTAWGSGAVFCTGSQPPPKVPASGPGGTKTAPTPVPAPQITGQAVSVTGGPGGAWAYWPADQGVMVNLPIEGGGRGYGMSGGGSGSSNTGVGVGEDGSYTDPGVDPDMPIADPAAHVEEHEGPLGGFSGAFDFGIEANAPCPAPIDVAFFGSTIEIDLELACDGMRIIRPYVIATAAAMSLYLLVTMGR